ncbi:MAG: hypothetical protein BRD33_04735 [Bacteroidetes bacterium QH_6_63_17]|nr:MAG: hypothetical protein BRD33_04735 [Bacteroidetes bacterium QH_6_63_17]
MDDGDNVRVDATPQPVVAEGKRSVVELVLEKHVEIGRGEPAPEQDIDILDRPQRVRPLRLLEDGDVIAPRLKVLNEPAVVEVPTGPRA